MRFFFTPSENIGGGASGLAEADSTTTDREPSIPLSKFTKINQHAQRLAKHRRVINILLRESLVGT